MIELRELVSVIINSTQNKVHLKVGSPNNLLQEFLDGVVSGDFTSDSDASYKLYQTDPNFENFRKLKDRLKNKLYDKVLQIDFNSNLHSDSQKVYYTCHKQLSLVQILLAKSAKHNAIKLAEKLLKKSFKYHLTNVSLELASILRAHNATNKGDIKRFEYYNDEVNKLMRCRQAEIVAEEYYHKISINFTISKAVRPDLEPIAIQLVNDLNEKFNDVETRQFKLFQYQLEVSRYQLVEDYENVIRVCEKACDYFSSLDLSLNNMIFIFKFHEFNSYLHLGNFIKGEKVANEAISLIPEGVPNWFYLHESLLLLAFSTENYNNALSIYKTVSNHPRFEFQYKARTENWKIYEAYLNFLIKIKIIETNSNINLKINKFLNEVPIYSKDKRGLNVAILIIQILHLLVKKDEEEVFNRIHALKMYCHRHLRNNESLRSNCFINLLIQFSKNDLDVRRTQLLGKKYFEKLSETTFDTTKSDVEIIPYEILWDIILNSFGKKPKGVKRLVA